jgi:predicted TIM-barrel fold metal-dependent hydrolase
MRNLQRMYLHMVTYNPPAVKIVLDWMGADRVLYGGDAAPMISQTEGDPFIRDLDMPDGDKQSIFAANALRLLKHN